MKEKNNQKCDELLLCCFSYFSQQLPFHIDETASLLQDGYFWRVILFLEQSSIQNHNHVESKQLLNRIIQQLTKVITHQPDEIILSILRTIEYVSESITSSSSVISRILQGLNVNHHSLSSQSVLLVYHLLLHFLPQEMFISVQPNYDSVVFRHQLSAELLLPANHLSLLVNQWNETYTSITQIPKSSWNEAYDDSFFTLEFEKNELLQSIQDDDALSSFILLLSEVLTQFGVSTVFHSFSSLE